MRQETLLVVEDNYMLRMGLQDMLELEGFSVHTAVNGREGLKKLATLHPDLILSDIAMPHMDGYAFFRAVRARPEWMAIPFIFLSAHSDRRDILAGKDLGAEDYLVKPLSRDELVSAVRARISRSRQLRSAQLQQAYQASLALLANAIEVRDQYTRGHVERVTAYSLLLGDQLGWQSWRLEQLRIAAILHDVGKIHIQQSILIKAGPLDPAEWDEIKQHPVTGAEMIKGIPFLLSALPVVRHHHERWDGSGYPDGLAGEAIPLAARIVSIADGFDAMTTDRPYRPARTFQGAYQEVLRCAGSQYDPAVVAAFKTLCEAGRISTVLQGWDVLPQLDLLPLAASATS